MRVGSLFSGIGGLDLGLERAGMSVAWQCEINKQARQVLATKFPDIHVFDDVKEIHAHPALAVDVLCGGFPCQDLSVAGRRAGLAGERSGLFFEFMRIALGLRPTWVVIENVPGLLSSDAGRDMGTVLGTLADIGYGWAYRVLDAQFFGVPQRRRRVFIVGCLGDPARAAAVLLEPEGLCRNPAPGREAGPAVATLTANGVGTCGADDNQGRAGHLLPVPALTTRCGNTQDDQQVGQRVARPVFGFSHTQGLDPQVSTAALATLRCEGGGHAVAFSENQRGELVESDYAHALSGGGGKPGSRYPACLQGMAVRRLTPVECERLQGFPDNWTEGLSDAARYRTLGNAVCVPVAEWIGRRIMAVSDEYGPADEADWDAWLDLGGEG